MPTISGRRPRNPLMEAAKEGAKRGRAERRTRGSTQDMLDRARRSQGMEAGEQTPPRVSRNAKGGKTMSTKKYAKGGSIDGCATKGKTKTKMVKMAMGGMAGKPAMTGLARAAEASGRAMPAKAGADARGRAMVAPPGTVRTMRKGGKTKMAKGGKTC